MLRQSSIWWDNRIFQILTIICDRLEIPMVSLLNELKKIDAVANAIVGRISSKYLNRGGMHFDESH